MVLVANELKETILTFRYIGSKARLSEYLKEFIGAPVSPSGRFVDAFCGTGAVAEVAAKLGWPIWLNDHLVSAGIVAAARLISKDQVKFEATGGYLKTIKILNELEPVKGYIWREYSPASSEYIGIERRYFTEVNAAQIDAIRTQIGKWKVAGDITNMEERLLIAELLSATNRVANIAGTYGCFLATWTRQSESTLMMTARKLNSKKTDIITTNDNVADLIVSPDDLVYLDPPYTKRQYASYYHILETISIGDEPEVEGVAGLRPWRDKASDFCYKTRALVALSDLIRSLNAKRILLSYSAEGHIPIDDLHNKLAQIGNVKTHPLTDVGRYRPNKAACAANSSVSEYLIEIVKLTISDAREVNS